MEGMEAAVETGMGERVLGVVTKEVTGAGKEGTTEEVTGVGKEGIMTILVKEMEDGTEVASGTVEVLVITEVGIGVMGMEMDGIMEVGMVGMGMVGIEMVTEVAHETRTVEMGTGAVAMGWGE
ncbi:hypothetical protein CBR_g30223 [Chara braunii]|uniref:Uncharacterized protein n=1 Tax=Chara braunii TaxID=69332 RepID=A0A388LCC9_CHABU|nr:hypothetical protein CBR_g30223 [Chara braunii]|eukprot:GBG79961.1 hypothetical protein CBR_g30223 [Chara braunii]